jgi:hypothetical protein
MISVAFQGIALWHKTTVKTGMLIKNITNHENVIKISGGVCIFW